MSIFKTRLKQLQEERWRLLDLENQIVWPGNGIYDRYTNPVLTAAHAPIFWEYDLNPDSNPFLMKRFEINGTFNAGAIKNEGKYLVVARVEGSDRKSFFAVAESATGIDNFKFWDHPLVMPETDVPDGNVYDMRLTRHEDGFIYGLFCTERKDPRQNRATNHLQLLNAELPEQRI